MRSYISESNLGLTPLLRPSSIITSNLSQEVAPDPFRVEYFWKDGGKTFDNYAFYNQMIENMAAIANLPWNESTQVVRFSDTYDIQMQFVYDVSGPGMMTKHVVWALEEVFDILVEHNRYQTGTIEVNSNWWSDRLALGSITVPSKLSANSDNLTEMISNSTGELARQAQIDTQNDTQLSATNQSINFLTRPNDDISITFAFSYRHASASIDIIQTYNATLRLLIKNAEAPLQALNIWPVVSVYNDMDNFTLSVRPLSFQQQRTLSYHLTSLVLCLFPLNIGVLGVNAYAELAGVINVLGKPTGLLCLDNGDRTGWDVSRLCQPIGGFGRVDEDGGVAVL